MNGCVSACIASLSAMTCSAKPLRAMRDFEIILSAYRVFVAFLRASITVPKPPAPSLPSIWKSLILRLFTIAPVSLGLGGSRAVSPAPGPPFTTGESLRRRSASSSGTTSIARWEDIRAAVAGDAGESVWGASVPIRGARTKFDHRCLAVCLCGLNSRAPE